MSAEDQERRKSIDTDRFVVDYGEEKKFTVRNNPFLQREAGLSGDFQPPQDRKQAPPTPESKAPRQEPPHQEQKPQEPAPPQPPVEQPQPQQPPQEPPQQQPQQPQQQLPQQPQEEPHPDCGFRGLTSEERRTSMQGDGPSSTNRSRKQSFNNNATAAAAGQDRPKPPPLSGGYGHATWSGARTSSDPANNAEIDFESTQELVRRKSLKK